jgi:hypothetical protein
MGFYKLAKSRLPHISVDEVSFGEKGNPKTVSTRGFVELAEHEVALLKQKGHRLIEQPAAPSEVAKTENLAVESEKPVGDDIPESPLVEHTKEGVAVEPPHGLFQQVQQPAQPATQTTEAL